MRGRGRKSGRGRKDEKEEEGGGSGGGWASTFWKVAATAVVADVLYSVLKQPEAEGSGGGWASTFWKVAATAVVARGLYSVLKQPEAEVEAGGSSGGGAVWTPPKVGWYKLNVDGSLLREIQSAGCGGVLRNDAGRWVKGFAEKLEYSSSLKEHEAEIEGILKGLKWAKEKLGVRKLEVESDNEGIVKKVTNGSNSKDPRILEIRELLSSTPNWQATLAAIDGKLANKVADKLADIASRNLTSFDLKEFDDPPPSCIALLAKDSHLLY